MGTEPRQTTPTWLSAVAIAALVVGAVVAMLGLSSAAEANEDRDTASAEAATQRQLVTDAEQDLADLRLDLENAQAQVTETATILVEQESARDEATVRLSTAEQLLQETTAEIPERRAEAQAFVEASSPLVDAAFVYFATCQRLLELRIDQEAEALDRDYRSFNRLQDQYDDLTEVANVELEAMAEVVAALPSLTGARALAGPSTERLAASEVSLAPPTGRARIEASTTADPIPCTPYSGNGCRYNWEVTFTQTNWLQVTIDRVAIRYYVRSGRSYWYSTSGEWRDVSIIIPAGGTASYDGSVRTAEDDDMRLIIGGRLTFRYRGTDADGNSISGQVTVRLERPDA